MREAELIRADAESAIRTSERAWERSPRAVVTIGAGFLHMLATDVLALLDASGPQSDMPHEQAKQGGDNAV